MSDALQVTVIPEETGASAPPAAAERPTWLPEKFKSPEDLAKAYSELETKLGAPKVEEAPAAEDRPNEAAEAEKAEADKAVEADLAAKGVDYEALATEVQTTGTLSPESYAKLEGAGIPKALVDDYIGSKREAGERMVAELYAEIGGEERANEMLAWAATGYTPAQIEAFNRAAKSGAAAELQAQVRALKVAFDAAAGSEPKYLDTPRTPAAVGDVYKSMAEMLKDQADPQYATDPAFRAKVRDKLARSRI